MAKEQKKKILSTCGPITRKLLHEAYLNGSVDEKTLIEWRDLEKEVYQRWKDKTYFILEKKGVLFLYMNCVETDDVSKNYNIIKKLYEREKNKDVEKQLRIVLETLEFYRDQKKNLYRLASQKSKTGITPQILCELRQEIDAINREKKQQKTSLKAVKTAIKEACEAFERGETPSIELLKLALNPEASQDNGIYADQVVLVSKTYVTIKEGTIQTKDVPQEIKEVTFEYIKKSAEYSKYMHVVLINYIFLNNTLSEQAYDLLVKMKADITKVGMGILPFANAKSIVEAKGLINKKRKTAAEKRLIAIMELYDPQVPSIH